eukprot:jgi/Psemu1/288092/fgenesh1_pg.235_\
MTPTPTPIVSTFIPDDETSGLQCEEVQALEAIFDGAFELRSSRCQEGQEDDDVATFEFPIVYRIKLNDMDASDGICENEDHGGTKNWPKQKLTVEVQYPKNYLSDNEDEDDQDVDPTTVDPSFRLLHENSGMEFPSSVSEKLLAILGETAENERGMPCVLSCLYAARHKFQLTGFYKFGTPGIAMVWGDRDNIDQFLDTLKRAMPQKKIELIFSRTCDDDNDDDDTKDSESHRIPKGWESVDPPTLKQELENFGVPEEDYYVALGLEKKDVNCNAGKSKGNGKGKNK